MTHNRPLSSDNPGCEVIRDLLPLYHDNICSADSRALVETHLSECPACRGIMEKLNQTTIDDTLAAEKETVLTAHARKERRRTFAVGAGTAAFLTIPVIICLIVNLATGHALDWFFIVLASLLVVASLTVVPMMAPDHTVLWTLGSFVCSLLTLLLVICLYTRGSWFFLAAVPTVFGLSVLFLPVVIWQLPLPQPLAHAKGLLVMLWDTVWLYLVIFVCGIYAGGPHYWRIALEITTFCVALPWLIFLVLRYLRVRPLIRTGIVVTLCGIYCAVTNGVVSVILGEPWRVTALNMLIAVYLLVIGLAMVAGGVIREVRRGGHETDC